MSITIKTHLDAGIYKSEGGGETRTHHEWATGPRNLLKAIKALEEHKAAMKRSYGNIGCGRSWLEIDNQPIHWMDLEATAQDESKTYGASAPAWVQSPTQKARELLAEVKAGKYDSNKYN